MAITTDAHGDKWAQTVNDISREWNCHSGTIGRYTKLRGCPQRDPKLGWRLKDLRDYIINNHRPNHRLLGAMAASIGEEAPGTMPDDDPEAVKSLSFRSRIERARAIKLETEVAVLKADLIHIDVFRQFFSEAIPRTIGELRRQMENVLPAIQEGMTAAEIRKAHREHVDKVLKNFSERAEEFKEKIEHANANATRIKTKA